jgi:redox-sensitive bicupin YhaK (pirin superfamily)
MGRNGMTSEVRPIRKIVTGSRQVDGAGVKLVRVLGPDTAGEFDPFLMLDAFDEIDKGTFIR